MNKICTSLEQSKKLIELGVDENTADMYYGYDYNSPIGGYEEDAQIIPQSESDQHFSLFPEDIPAWSLSALLGLMPDKISINNESYYLSFTKKSVGFRGPITWDGQKAKSFEMNNILDAAFEMIVWLKQERNI